MKGKGKDIGTFIRRSCITGKIIWVYRGVKTGERYAYWRACKKEIERIRQWGERLERRRRNISLLLSDSSSNIPITGEMTPEQREAAQLLHDICHTDVQPHMEFYEHIMEERRRREEDHEIRRQMREREKQNNANYDK